jgi:hypothetical protein
MPNLYRQQGEGDVCFYLSQQSEVNMDIEEIEPDFPLSV